MLSMTGYGQVQASLGSTDYEVNIKTVNNRFLEFRVHLPKNCKLLEPQIIKIIKSNLNRGYVEVYVRVAKFETESSIKFSSSPELAKKWLKTYLTLQKSLNLKEDKPSLKDILNQCPSVISKSESTSCTEKEGQFILTQVRKAVQACNKERKREGSALQQDLKKQTQQLLKNINAIQDMKSDMNKKLNQKYKSRLQKIGLKSIISDERVAQEIVIAIDKTDINEEMERLNTHILRFNKLIGTHQSQGKKLDFYTQELLREVNTIGSKAQWSPITEKVIAAKSIIERIREQVQNVE